MFLSDAHYTVLLNSVKCIMLMRMDCISLYQIMTDCMAVYIEFLYSIYFIVVR